MKTFQSKRHPAGYVSLLVVLTTGTLLVLLMIAAYKRAADAQSVQAKAQLRIDYAEKEETILRSILTITPNRAIRAMQDGSAATGVRDSLSWQRILGDALDLANARNSVSDEMREEINLPKLLVTSSDDGKGVSALGSIDKIFTSIVADEGYVSAGLNRNSSLGAGYPSSLFCSATATSVIDGLYPIISDYKYDPAATADIGPQFNGRSKFRKLKYPKINFGYAKPGDNFVAKRNWWAFSLDVAANDRLATKVATTKRDFVLSIYEIPSQLAISAASFMALGAYESGDEWENVTIGGGMFVGEAEVGGTNTTYNALSSRRGMTVDDATKIGGVAHINDQFAAGAREEYQVDPTKILPVSLASESSRATFIPISRGKEMVGTQPVYPFFDRFANTAEANVLSSTSWNNYSSGAMQCAMRLTVTKVNNSLEQIPTMFEFEYYPPTGNRLPAIQVPQNDIVLAVLPPGFVQICSDGDIYDLDTLAGGAPVDVAYGSPTSAGPAGWTFRSGLSGKITFGEDTFGDPSTDNEKYGYWRPRAPFGTKNLINGTTTQTCIAVYPERFPAFLDAIGGGSTERNHSLVVNVDYTQVGPTYPLRPQIPCRDIDYGLILQECANLTSFSKGFSLVSNLRIYFGDDFNIVPKLAGGTSLPPCSLFAPEKRYGADVSPLGISLSGQIGSLAQGSKVNDNDEIKRIRPLDSKTMMGDSIASDSIEVNLSPLLDPADLPPITMMNWLVIIEERRSELYEAP